MLRVFLTRSDVLSYSWKQRKENWMKGQRKRRKGDNESVEKMDIVGVSKKRTMIAFLARNGHHLSFNLPLVC